MRAQCESPSITTANLKKHINVSKDLVKNTCLDPFRITVHLTPELRRDQATREERDTVAGGESLDTLNSARPYAIFGSCAPGPGPRSPARCKRTMIIS